MTEISLMLFGRLSMGRGRNKFQTMYSLKRILSKSKFFPIFVHISKMNQLQWLIKNRGGLALLSGQLIVPAQFLGDDCKTSLDIINRAKAIQNLKLRQIRDENGHILKYLIYYPPECKELDTCILYHNPNAVTVSKYFNRYLTGVPLTLCNIAKCPIILYDYRGVGMNSDCVDDTFESSSSPMKFRPTYQSIIEDGLTMLKIALAEFKKVKVVGTSLGGAVATISLDKLLSQTPEFSKNIEYLFNHDSFTTSPRVLFPSLGKFVDYTGWLIGACIDAEKSMKSLINHRINIICYCTKKDPVIPPGARMAEFVGKYPHLKHIIIYSYNEGHGTFHPDTYENLELVV